MYTMHHTFAIYCYITNFAICSIHCTFCPISSIHCTFCPIYSIHYTSHIYSMHYTFGAEPPPPGGQILDLVMSVRLSVYSP